MKFFVIALVMLITFACGEKSTTNVGSTELQTYNLTAMSSGQIVGDTNNALEWEEAYMLGEDFSFEKVRVRDGETITASGNYERKAMDDGEYLILNYEKAHPLIGNCSGDYTETLRIVDETKLQGTWIACDGPALTYTLKVN
ncbi:hypothetical protein [Dokdonia sinensis]|uniref:hypothetical protein n=1 Tax=Dokdonia sinensis TaxID=2479847 RepID=UPI001F3D038F|nr:hypothetical protein [Dokdonia sinensis]